MRALRWLFVNQAPIAVVVVAVAVGLGLLFHVATPSHADAQQDIRDLQRRQGKDSDKFTALFRSLGKLKARVEELERAPR